MTAQRPSFHTRSAEQTRRVWALARELAGDQAGELFSYADWSRFLAAAQIQLERDIILAAEQADTPTSHRHAA